MKNRKTILAVAIIAILCIAAVAGAASWVNACRPDPKAPDGYRNVRGWQASIGISRGYIPTYEIKAQWRPGVALGEALGVKVNGNLTILGRKAPNMMTVDMASNFILANQESVATADSGFIFTFMGAVSIESNPSMAVSGQIHYSDGSTDPFSIFWEKGLSGTRFVIGEAAGDE